MTTPLKTFSQNVNEKLDYTIDYTACLLDLDDSISESTWSAVSGSGLTLTGGSIHGYKASVFVSSGTAGTTYRVANRVVTTGGRIFEPNILIYVEAV